MAMFNCDSCGRFYPEPWCDKDQRSLTTVVPDADIPRDAMAAAIARNTAQLSPSAATTPPPPKPKPQAAPSPFPQPALVAAPKPEPSATPRPRPTPAPAASPQPVPARTPTPLSKAIVGLDQFVGMLQSGREAVVICGGGKSGKSEIANAFIKALAVYRRQAEIKTIRTRSKTRDILGGTNPDEVWYQPAGRRHVFLDPSGEFYRLISPTERQRLELPDITEEHFNFLRPAVQRLAGLVLVFDLTKVANEAETSLWQEQEEEFNFTLAIIKWLRFPKRGRKPDLGLTDTIATQSARTSKLDVPVLVLFSKADMLDDTYTYQPPLTFAREYLPRLHSSLVTHARWFRYDFCHTMERTGSGDRAIDRPVGVLLSMEWLLQSRSRWLPRFSTITLGGGR